MRQKKDPKMSWWPAVFSLGASTLPGSRGGMGRCRSSNRCFSGAVFLFQEYLRRNRQSIVASNKHHNCTNSDGEFHADQLQRISLFVVFWLGTCFFARSRIRNSQERAEASWIGYIIFGVIYGCFRRLWVPQINHFNRVFHYRPSILGYHYFWKHHTGWWFQIWFLFSSRKLGKWSNLTNFFQRGWNHQPVYILYIYICTYTLLKTHMSPDKWWLEEYMFSFWNGPFSGDIRASSGGGTFMERKWGSTSDWLVFKVGGLL